MSVYVDDIMLSGPKHLQAAVWARLRDPKCGNVKTEDPELLDRYLGRDHKIEPRK